MKAFFLYCEGIFGADELFVLLEPLFNEANVDFDQFRSLALSREQNRRKLSWFCMNLQEYYSNQKNNIKRVDKSYSRLPLEFLMPVCSGKDEICKEVLNDDWVSIPIGSEDFKFSSRNNFEQEIYQVEDQRYYYDQAIKCNQDLIQVLESAEKEIAESKEEEYSLGPEFTKFRLAWIKHNYNSSVQVMNALFDKPA